VRTAVGHGRVPDGSEVLPRQWVGLEEKRCWAAVRARMMVMDDSYVQNDKRGSLLIITPRTARSSLRADLLRAPQPLQGSQPN